MRTAIVLACGLCSAALAAPPGLYPMTISDTDITSVPLTLFIGPPDDQYAGLGNQYVTYDFGGAFVLDGPGPDLNVYEVDWGSPEFSLMDVLVSTDGVEFFSIKSSMGVAIPLAGAETHSNANFSKSFDLGPSAFLAVRYVKIQGTGTGNAGGSNDFDLDAIGIINFVPAPSAVALVAAVGLTALRRRR